MAAQVGLSEWAVRRAIHDGELAASKLRGRLRIDALDLEAWIQDSRVAGSRPVSADLPRGLTPSPEYPQAGSFRDRMRQKGNG